MKFSSAVKISACAVLGVVLLFALQRIPHEGYQSPISADELQKTIKRDRPSDVGNADAEAMLRNVEREPVIPATGVIKLSDETFSPGYDEIYDNREKYYGREISVSGYVETDDLPPGQFLVGRDLVWCCQQDKYFIGFLALTDGKVPSANAELRVTGVLEAVNYTDPESGKTFLVPAIRVKTTESAPKFNRQVFPG